MRYFGCGINKIVSVLIRPGSVVRVHNGPPKVIFARPACSFSSLTLARFNRQDIFLDFRSSDGRESRQPLSQPFLLLPVC